MLSACEIFHSTKTCSLLSLDMKYCKRNVVWKRALRQVLLDKKNLLRERRPESDATVFQIQHSNC